jgi:hypothetical protein
MYDDMDVTETLDSDMEMSDSEIELVGRVWIRHESKVRISNLSSEPCLVS